MGEVGDMMIDGTLCYFCGIYIESDIEGGYPRYCSDECKSGHELPEKDSPPVVGKEEFGYGEKG